MTDFNELVRAAMAKNESIEDIIAIFTAEVQALKEQEKEKKEQEEAERYQRYHMYSNALINSYISKESAEIALITNLKISIHDMAVALAHFMCQNVPGYDEALAKTNTEPVMLYKDILDNQLKVAKIVAKHKDSGDGDRIAALISHLLDETLEDFLKDQMSSNGDASKDIPNTKNLSAKSESPTFFYDPSCDSVKCVSTRTDAEKIAAFMKKYCLF